MEIKEIIGFIAATFTTFSFLPQAIKTVKTKQTKDISLVMYLIFAIGLVLWEIYGIINFIWPIIISNIITLAFVVPILILKIIHK